MASLPQILKDNDSRSSEDRFLASKLVESLERYLSAEEIAKIHSAYLFGAQAHINQTRLSGEPYIHHPVAVAHIMAELRLDTTTICASLLHDVIEDTSVNKYELAEKFGAEVAEVVDGVSKLDRFAFERKESQQAKSFQKMMLAVAKDSRVILVKLGDRLHNMRTIKHLPTAKQKIIAAETMGIYAPLAQRLGMESVCTELEDLAFRVIYPLRYRVLKNELEVRMERKNKQFTELLDEVRQYFVKVGLECQVQGRKKHLYGIYRKMKEKHQTLSKVADIFAMRLIVKKVDDCYRALGIMHSFSKPVPGKFKDYIALPKPNGYQSLHTVLFGRKGITLEVQIRTYEMNKIAEIGIASHTAYKANDSQSKVDNTVQWLQGLTEIDDAERYMQNVKAQLAPEGVYPFTPNGEIIALPKNATALDFAFAIHTDIGLSTERVKINYRECALSTILRSGQTVEIITTDDAKPDPAWLGFVITGKARHAIHHYLKHMHHADALCAGKRLLQDALAGYATTITDISKERITEVANMIGEQDINDLCFQIGTGNQIPQLIAAYLIQETQTEETLTLMIGGSTANNLGIIVNYAKCCHPLPGDNIVATIGKERGMAIHRSECPNVTTNALANNAIVNLKWASQMDDKSEYQAMIRVVTPHKVGILARISSQIAKVESNIENIKFEGQSSALASVDFTVSVKNIEMLDKLMVAIEQNVSEAKVYRLGVKSDTTE